MQDSAGHEGFTRQLVAAALRRHELRNRVMQPTSSAASTNSYAENAASFPPGKQL